VIHANDAFAAKELAFIYLVIFIIMFFTGAGKYSVDAMIRKAME
jgi:putative oxidoreductase